MRRKLNCFLAYLFVTLQMVNPVFLCADDSSICEALSFCPFNFRIMKSSLVIFM